MRTTLALALGLLVGCEDNDGARPDAPDDLIVDSDAIFLDADDVDSLLDGGGDALDDFGDIVEPDTPAALVILSPSFLDFGAVAAGSSMTATAQVFNNGEFPAFLGQIEVFGPGFMVDSTTCVGQLGPFAFCDIVVSAAPPLGEQFGELLVRTDVTTLFANLRAVGVE